MTPTQIPLHAILNDLPIAITVTDCEGKIIFMNQASRAVNCKDPADSLIGKQIRECHTPRSIHIIEQLLQGTTNAYTITKQGKKKLIYQCPWREGQTIKGLIEFSILLPEELPHYVRS